MAPHLQFSLHVWPTAHYHRSRFEKCGGVSGVMAITSDTWSNHPHPALRLVSFYSRALPLNQMSPVSIRIFHRDGGKRHLQLVLIGLGAWLDCKKPRELSRFVAYASCFEPMLNGLDLLQQIRKKEKGGSESRKPYFQNRLKWKDHEENPLRSITLNILSSTIK